MRAIVSSCQLPTPEQEYARRTPSACSTRSSPPSRTAWGWACRFAARSSRRMKAGCGSLRTARGAPCFSSPCERIPRPSSLRMAEAGQRDSERAGHSHQLGERSSSHLLHDLAAMDLERDLADAELRRGLLVKKSARDQRKHLAL